MRYIRCRDYDDDESFPFMNGEELGFEDCNETLYEYWQPDAIEDDEFNTFILLNGEPVKVRSCHFDFVEA